MTLPTLSPEEALIFRITHRDNLPWILHHGLFAKSSQVLDPNFRKIGDLDLIDKRSRHPVPAGPRGTLGGYIPVSYTHLLQRALGLKVHIEDHDGRGKVIIEYAKLEDFDTLLEQLAGE